MNFCKMCGAALRGAAAAAANPQASTPPPPPGPTSGPKRSALPSALAAVVNPSASPFAKTGSKNVVPVPPKKPIVTTSPGTAAIAPTLDSTQLRTCASCEGTTPANFTFCQHCGTKLEGPPSTPNEAVAPATLADAGVADTISGDPLAPEIEIVPLVQKKPAAEPWGQLVSVRRDGSDGDRYPLFDEAIDIGRTDGTLTFEDRFLAPRHARIQRRGPGALVTPLEHTNGVYFKLRSGESCPIHDGDYLLIGKEVLRFEVVEPEERAQNTALQHGVRLFGSPVRSPWGRLRQIVQSGVARDIYHLSAAEAVVGREDGDLRFTDDEFMSRRHAKLANRDGQFEIADLDSSNGTFVRVRGDRALKKGDVIRLGDQLFRFEPSA